MSAFKQKLARLGATAGVLAASTAAFMAVGGVTAGSALATPTCETITGITSLKGQGSTLQRVAQENWTSKYNTACPNPKVNFTYEGTGSGAALTAFAYNGTVLDKTFAYVGSDEAPESGQIANAKSHANSVAPVIIPVAQTSIAVIANKPSVCVITGGIPYKDLNKLFNGETSKWSQISTVTGTNKTNCEAEEKKEKEAGETAFETSKEKKEAEEKGKTKAEIEALKVAAGVRAQSIHRVVREDSSGTTFQFKNYLNELTKSPISAAGPGSVNISTTPGTVTCSAKTWEQLRPGGGSPVFNLLWPETNCNSGRQEVIRANGGGGVVSKVSSTANTIGYASYSDVFSGGAVAKALQLQDGEVSGIGPTYAKPGKNPSGKTGEPEANCSKQSYTVPVLGREEGTHTGLEVDWSKVFGALPTAQEPFYPLCTLTFDLSWNDYSTVGYTEGAKVGKSVNDYLSYILNEGQTLLGEHGYEALPSPTSLEHNVLGAAKFALKQVK